MRLLNLVRSIAFAAILRTAAARADDIVTNISGSAEIDARATSAPRCLTELSYSSLDAPLNGTCSNFSQGSSAGATGTASIVDTRVTTSRAADGTIRVTFHGDVSATASHTGNAGGAFASVSFSGRATTHGVPGLPFSVSFSPSVSGSGIGFHEERLVVTVNGAPLFCNGDCDSFGGPFSNVPLTGVFPASGVLATEVQLLAHCEVDEVDNIAASAAGVTLSISFTLPTEMSWKTPIGGEYGDFANWDPALVPAFDALRSDVAKFELSGGSPIPIHAANATAARWEISGMKVHLNGSASILGAAAGLDDLSITNGGGLILDGNDGASSLTATAARIQDGEIKVNAQSGSAALIVRDALSVDGGPNIELLVENGGEVTSGGLFLGRFGSASAADVTVRGVSPTGVRSTLAVNGATEPTLVGMQAPGRLNIQAGGSVALFGGLTVGQVGDGFVLVSGQGAPAGVVTELRVEGITSIGADAASSVEVLAGGRVTTRGNVNVGVQGTGSSLTVSNSSFLDVGGSLAIGASARGDLDIRDGASVVCDSLAVGGDAARAGGLVTLDGLVAFLTVRGNANIGVGPGSGDIILGDGSRMVVNGTMTIGGGLGGEVLLLDAQIDGSGNILVGQDGRLSGIGTVSVPKTRLAGTNAFISPGLSPGTLTIDGDYEQAEGGTLIIEVAGLEPGKFDVLHVTGNATLSGSVELRFIDGFVPQPGDNVDFVVVDGTITGKLTGSTFVDAPGDPDAGQPAAQTDIVWEVTPDGTCRLTVTDVTPVDANGVPLPPACGAGLCGAGVVPMAGPTWIALCGWRGVSALRKRRLS